MVGQRRIWSSCVRNGDVSELGEVRERMGGGIGYLEVQLE